MTALQFALVGDPVIHSMDPPMHAAAFAAMKLPHAYTAIRATAEDLPLLVERLRQGEFGGLNVTNPHKRHVLELVDAVHSGAAIVGAANTLARDASGRVTAYNTVIPALAEELRKLGPEIDEANGWEAAGAIVLGTGATARSAIVALACELGIAQIVVRGDAFEAMEARDRFAAEMEELLTCAGVTTGMRLEPWRASLTTDRRMLAIVQTTHAGVTGVYPSQAATDAVAWDALPDNAIALDVACERRDTPFLRAAIVHRLRTANGFRVVARQGALAFERWLGIPAPYEAMAAALLS